MGVYVNFKGQLGNNLFQYCAGRLLAERNGVSFHGVFPFSDTITEVEPVAAENEVPPEGHARTLTDLNAEIPGMILREHEHVVLNGWFQRWDWYWPHRDAIKKWFAMPFVEENLSDAVAHVRLGDYKTSWASGSRIIHPRWYNECARKAGGLKTWMVMQALNPAYISDLSIDHASYTHASECADFHFMRRFSRMIMSNSTFAWWAFFLGHGKRAWVFPRWVDDPQVQLTGFPGAEPVDGDFWR